VLGCQDLGVVVATLDLVKSGKGLLQRLETLVNQHGVRTVNTTRMNLQKNCDGVWSLHCNGRTGCLPFQTRPGHFGHS
jgi:hypothetical protein